MTTIATRLNSPAYPRSTRPPAHWESWPAGTRPSPAGGADLLPSPTEREREVLALVGSGLSNEDIARRLVLSPHTAKTHVNRAMTKLGAHDRAQLVIVAYQAGLLGSGRPESC